jgi:nucleoside 2-deoxyribosyltransferase
MLLSMDQLVPLRNLHRVYCAGPLFNAAERREMLEIAEVLNQSGFETFVPHADGMEFAQARPYLVARGHRPERVGQWLHEAIFALDTYQVVVRCGSLVFNMNGRTPDEGGVAECTMAWMLGKPIVLFKEDDRSAIAGRDNPLVVGPANFRTERELSRLGEALAATIAAHPLTPQWRAACPPQLAHWLEIGERLWDKLESLGPQRDPEQVAEFMLQLFTADDGSGGAAPASHAAAAYPERAYLQSGHPQSGPPQSGPFESEHAALAAGGAGRSDLSLRPRRGAGT